MYLKKNKKIQLKLKKKNGKSQRNDKVNLDLVSYYGFMLFHFAIAFLSFLRRRKNRKKNLINWTHNIYLSF